MDRIIIIDDSGIQKKLEKFLLANKNNIRLNTDMDEIALSNDFALSEIIKTYEEKHKLKIHTKSRVWFFKSREIIRFEALEKDTRVYLTNQNRPVINENIDEVENQIKDFSFLRIHNKHIINMNHIARIFEDDSEKISLLNGDVLPVEKLRKQYILESIEKHNKL